jgi:hypothetical protein
LSDYVYFIKLVTNSVTTLKTKSHKTLILRDLHFKEVVPPGIEQVKENENMNHDESRSSESVLISKKISPMDTVCDGIRSEDK